VCRSSSFELRKHSSAMNFTRCARKSELLFSSMSWSGVMRKEDYDASRVNIRLSKEFEIQEQHSDAQQERAQSSGIAID